MTQETMNQPRLNLDLSRKPKREITISSHFTEKMAGMAVRVDMMIQDMERALSRGSMEFGISTEIQTQLNSLLIGTEETIRQLTKKVRRHAPRGGQRARPVRGGSNTAKAGPKPGPAKSQPAATEGANAVKSATPAVKTEGKKTPAKAKPVKAAVESPSAADALVAS